MGRRYVPDSAISFRLEEPITVNYTVVGTPEWFHQAIPLDFPRSQLLEVHGSSDIEPIRRNLLAERVLAADTESSGDRENDGLDAVSPSSRVVLGQFGTRKHVFVVEPKLLPELTPVIEHEKSLKLLQNAVHDFRFLLAKYHIHIVRMFCTMLAEQVLTAGLEGVGVGLADLVRKYQPHYIISKNVREDFIHFKGRFSKEMLYYAARDVFLMFPVFDAQVLLLKDHGLTPTAKKEFDIIPATAEMGLTGVFCDAVYLRQTIEYFTRKRDETIEKVFQIYNTELKKLGLVKVGLLGEEYETFNLKSHQEVRARLRRIGIEVEKTDYDTMIRLDHPIGKPLADLSGYNKVLDNYGEPLIARIHWATGRVHPNFDQLGAGENAQRNGKDKKETIATGRFSSDFQQLPRPEKILDLVTGPEEVRVRAFFAARIAELELAAQQKAA